MEKETRKNQGIPKYQQIAADIAYRVVDGTYAEGTKIYARSSIGSTYGVSAETARRAVCVLADWDVVEVEQNSGVIIRSRDNARNFLQQHESVKTLQELKRSILDNVERQKQEMKELSGHLNQMIERAETYRSSNPFAPYEIEITGDAVCIDKTVGEMEFWQKTFATIIAIRRNGVLMMSPGPKAVFKRNDIVYYTGREECQKRVKSLMYPENKK